MRVCNGAHVFARASLGDTMVAQSSGCDSRALFEVAGDGNGGHGCLHPKRHVISASSDEMRCNASAGHRKAFLIRPRRSGRTCLFSCALYFSVRRIGKQSALLRPVRLICTQYFHSRSDSSDYCRWLLRAHLPTSVRACRKRTPSHRTLARRSNKNGRNKRFAPHLHGATTALHKP